MSPSLLDPEQVAERLGVTARWVKEAAARSELPGLKLGRYWRFHEQDLTDWINRQRDSARKEAGL